MASKVQGLHALFNSKRMKAFGCRTGFGLQERGSGWVLGVLVHVGTVHDRHVFRLIVGHCNGDRALRPVVDFGIFL